MRKILILSISGLLFLTGCRDRNAATSAETGYIITETVETETSEPEELESIDPDADVIDLTRLSSTFVYSEVFHMMQEPEKYMDKTIKMEGIYRTSYSEETDQNYHFVVIEDATACCQQGMEFILNERLSYPSDETRVEVSGTFESYEEGDSTYYYVKADEINLLQ